MGLRHGSAAIGMAVTLLLPGFSAAQAPAQPQTQAQAPITPPRKRPADVLSPPTRDDLLRGSYGPYRANNDLLSYTLKLRVDPIQKTIAGSNTVRFRMLEDGAKIQLELTPDLTLDSISCEGATLHYTREERTLWIELPRTLHKNDVAELVLAYHGKPVAQGRFGCFRFDKDKAGRPWITTACEDGGASLWWPDKDQWNDEPQDGMELDIAVPNGLMDVSNGRFVGSRDLGDGYTEWQWRVHYPINSYDVALNIGDYRHWSEEHVNKQSGEKTSMDFYALPEDLEKAKTQFEQASGMLDAFEHYFGEYPFDEDGYKLVQVPYAGMEHQTAVGYGNRFENGYYGRDWTGVGISPKFDFIIIHESAHEWFGNAITARDRSDMWIHEGWATYLEGLYVEYRWGKDDALRYLNGLKPKVRNERPILTPRGVNANPSDDQYFKGALMLNTLRSVIDDDTKWFAGLHDFYQTFKYKTIMTEDVVAWWSARTGMDLKPFFNAYLRQAKIPVLELRIDPPKDAGAKAIVNYRWRDGESAFAMPVKVGDPQHWTTITPVVTEWKTMPWDPSLGRFQVATDLYDIDVEEDQP